MDSNDIVKGTTVASDVSLGIGKASQGISYFRSKYRHPGMDPNNNIYLCCCVII